MTELRFVTGIQLKDLRDAAVLKVIDFDREIFQAGAPATDSGFFLVPKVLS